MLAALLTLPGRAAHAQDGSSFFNFLADRPADPEAEAKRAEIDRAYQASKKKIPEAQKQPSDPWGSVRTAEPAKPAQKKSANVK